MQPRKTITNAVSPQSGAILSGNGVAATLRSNSTGSAQLVTHSASSGHPKHDDMTIKTGAKAPAKPAYREQVSWVVMDTSCVGYL